MKKLSGKWLWSAMGLALAAVAAGVLVANTPGVQAAEKQAAFIKGVVTNDCSNQPVAGAQVILSAGARKQLDIKTTDANGNFDFTGSPGLTAGNSYYVTCFKLEYFPPQPLLVQASTDAANIPLHPLNVTTPGAPIARSGPRSVYLEWAANPEFNIKGYNLYRATVSGENVNVAEVPDGDFVKVNAGLITVEDLESHLTRPGTEFIDETVVRNTFYVYKVEAMGGADCPSQKSPASAPPVPGEFLTVHFPLDVVYDQNPGLYLWENNGDGSNKLRIPISSKCAYEVNASAMQVGAYLPKSILNEAALDEMEVKTTGITAGMGFQYSFKEVTENPDVIQLLIAAAGIEQRELFGAGDLFNVYVKTKVLETDTCGPLTLLDGEDDPKGTKFYAFDEAGTTLPIALVLKNGELCKGAGCQHGDADGDGDVDADDADYILSYWVGNVGLGNCLPESGDINLDSYVDSADATQILRWLAKMPINPGIGTPITKAEAEELEATSFAYAGSLPEKQNAQAIVEIGEAKGAPGDTIQVPITITGAAPTAGFVLQVSYPLTTTANTGAVTAGVAYLTSTLGSALQTGFKKQENHGTVPATNNTLGYAKIAVASTDQTLGKAGETELIVLSFKMGPGVDPDVAVPITLTSFNQNDKWGFAPRQTAPFAPFIRVKLASPLGGEGEIVVTVGKPKGCFGGTIDSGSTGSFGGKGDGVVMMMVFAALLFMSRKQLRRVLAR